MLPLELCEIQYRHFDSPLYSLIRTLQGFSSWILQNDTAAEVVKLLRNDSAAVCAKQEQDQFYLSVFIVGNKRRREFRNTLSNAYYPQWGFAAGLFLVE